MKTNKRTEKDVVFANLTVLNWNYHHQRINNNMFSRKCLYAAKPDPRKANKMSRDVFLW